MVMLDYPYLARTLTTRPLPFPPKHCSAAAKSGKSVLQLSPNTSYGDAWASLDLDSFCQAISQDNIATDPISLVKSSNSAWMSSGTDLGSSHHYNIDLSPKVVMCAGKLIELLIGSGSHNYTEFKHIHSTYIKIKDQLIKVPSSKSEIFKDRFLELPQKRALMKFMTACTTMMMTMEEEENDSDSRSIVEFMKDHGCDDVLQSLVLHGVLLTETNSSSTLLSVRQGLEMLKTHSSSVGRYGPGTGAYLSPMYGCGEIPQALCRSAAVAGAVQALRCPIIKTLHCCRSNGETDDDDDDDDNEYQWTVNIENGGGQELRCKSFFDGSSMNKSSTLITMIHRCVAILDGPVIAGEGQSIIIIPSTSNGGEHSSVVWGVSLTHNTAVCPKGKALLYLWTSGNTNTTGDDTSSNKVLLEALDTLADTSHLVDYRSGDEGDDDNNEGEIVKRKVLLAMCYTQRQQREKDGQFSLPDASPTFEDAINVAKQAYFQLYPPPPEGEIHFPLDMVPPDRSTNECSDEDEELALLEELLSKSAVQ